jgi:hypothetical protein
MTSARRFTPDQDIVTGAPVAMPGGSFPAQDALGRVFAARVTAASLSPAPDADSTVTVEQLEELPPVVQRYLRFMGVLGGPRIWSFQARFRGRFWLRRELGWMPAEAWQYNSSLDVARLFVMRIRVARIVPMIGYDTYVGGHGKMIGKLFNRFTVADGQGDEFDIGELTTYLNDAILLAPSMLLGPSTTWTEIDTGSFDVTLSNAGHIVTGRVFTDNSGAPSDFSSVDRYAALPSGLLRAEWHTPVQSWQRIRGRSMPGHVQAVWHFPEGPQPYIKGNFLPESVQFNIGPASCLETGRGPRKS